MIATYAVLVGAAFVLLLVSGFAGPSNARWGLDALAFYPAWVRLAFAAAGGAGIAVAFASVRGAAGRGGDRSARSDDPAPAVDAAGGRVRWIIGGAVLLLAVGFFAFRERTGLTGRGYDILLELGQREAPSPVSPLYNLLAPAFVRLQREAGFPTVTEVGLISILAGVLVALTVAFLLGREAREEPEAAAGAALVGVLFATQGAATLFYGTVEASPLLVGALVLFFLFARAEVSGRGGLAGAAIAAAIAVATHPSGWALAPALVVTAALGPGPARRTRALLIGAGTIAMAVGLVVADSAAGTSSIWGALSPRRLGDLGARLARVLFEIDDAAPLRSSLSAGHALDVVNHLVLTGLPALLLVLALATRAEGRRALVRPAALVGLAAFLPFLALRIGTRTPLGPMRDWDQFAGLGVALTAWAAFAAAPLLPSMGRRARIVVGLALVSGILSSAPLIGIAADATRSVDRHLARVQGQPSLDPPVTASFHMAMGQRFLSISRADLSGSAFERAWNAWPAAATAWRAGLAFLAAGQVEKAAAAMTEVTRARPDDWRGWAELGNARSALGRFEEADEALHRAILLNAVAPAPRVYLARSLAMQGRAADARAHLEVARRGLDRRDPLWADFELLDTQLPPGFVPRTP